MRNGRGGTRRLLDWREYLTAAGIVGVTAIAGVGDVGTPVHGKGAWKVSSDSRMLADADGGAALVGLIAKSLDKQEVLTPEHRSSFSRVVSRLEERGLVWKRHRTVERESWDGDTKVVESRPSARAVRLGLTDDGETAADEILGRARDGRYGLAFETV